MKNTLIPTLCAVLMTLTASPSVEAVNTEPILKAQGVKALGTDPRPNPKAINTEPIPSPAKSGRLSSGRGTKPVPVGFTPEPAKRPKSASGKPRKAR
jgi:hypothetical protein